MRSLTQVNPIQVGASLLRHIHIHVEKHHRVSKVLLWAGIQHQNGVVSRRAVRGSLVPVQTLPPVQGSPGAETRLRLRAQHPAGGVRQNGQNLVRRTWTKGKEETVAAADDEGHTQKMHHAEQNLSK